MTAARKGHRDGLRLLPSGRWQARYTDASGQQIPQTFVQKSEAAAWRKQQQVAVENGSHIDPRDRTTVLQYANRWVEARPIRPATVKRYRGMIAAHLKDTRLGAMRLRDVRTTDVQEWVTQRSTRLAPTTLRRLFTFAQSIFKGAVADRMLTWSPCAGVRLPEAERVEHVLVTAEEAAAVADTVPARYRTLVHLLTVTGLRIGEALAVCADDIDRETGTLRVWRQLDQHARAFGPPKTPSSKRTVPLPRHLLTLLAEHQLAHPPLRDGDEFDGLLFTSAHGRPLRYDVAAYKVLRPAAAAAGVPHLRPHNLRHYAGSAMLHDGVPPATVAKVLGHSVEVLLRTYAHAMPSGDELARASMERRSRSGTEVARFGVADF